uniref:Uncharacterized protein n=1 Tax=Arundo donax TaxID=35708 RepID=A0A0A9FXQ3_ARUDO
MPPHSSQSQSFIRTRTPGLLHEQSEETMKLVTW